MYLGKREYVQCDGVIEPVQGVVYIQVSFKINIRSKKKFYYKDICILTWYKKCNNIPGKGFNTFLNYTIKNLYDWQDWKDTLKDRKVYLQLVVTFRHGREEDETMGISFKKELVIDRVQVKVLDPSFRYSVMKEVEVFV